MRPCAVASTAFLFLLATGCVHRYAINKLGDALASSGAVYASDEDPELIGSAAPFSLKLIESLLAESPNHGGLLLAACRGFTQYAYAYVHEPADEVEDRNFSEATQLRARARLLYLRARDYCKRGLEKNHPGLGKALQENPKALSVTTKSDVALLYWTAASWGSAISVSKDKPELVADQPIVEALIDRALALGESFESGAVHSFLITYEPSRLQTSGDPLVRSREHFTRAMTLAEGSLASPLVALAEAVSLKTQNRAEFESLLQRALAVDPNRRPEWRLENLLMQRRARWLLSKTTDLFLQN
jgi:predicted anti-sigma-YlaC factor YlaD